MSKLEIETADSWKFFLGVCLIAVANMVATYFWGFGHQVIRNGLTLLGLVGLGFLFLRPIYLAELNKKKN